MPVSDIMAMSSKSDGYKSSRGNVTPQTHEPGGDYLMPTEKDRERLTNQIKDMARRCAFMRRFNTMYVFTCETSQINVTIIYYFDSRQMYVLL